MLSKQVFLAMNSKLVQYLLVSAMSTQVADYKTCKNKSRFGEQYRIKGHLSAGAHGVILWAVNRQEPELESNFRLQYAIKRIFIRNRMVSISVVREIKVLQFLQRHPYVSAIVVVVI